MLRLAGPFWRRAGFECEIVSTGHSLGDYTAPLSDAGYVVHHLPIRRNPVYFREFTRFVRGGGYAVVHQHGEGMRYWFCLSALLAGARVATTVHSNFQFGGLLKWRRAFQRRHLQKLGVVFIAIAPGVLENERARFGIHPTLIWNWFDAGRFGAIDANERDAARRNFGYAAADQVVVSLGNCSVVKNHEAILRALPRVPGIKYLHVGQEDCGHSERALTIELGLQDRVQFAGWMQDPRAALAAADLYAMPSQYEGLGIAALEAIGSGLPCLLALSPGLVDLASLDLELTYADPSPDGTATALTAIFSDLSHLTAVSRANVSKVGDRLTPELGAAAYAGIWNELACGR